VRQYALGPFQKYVTRTFGPPVVLLPVVDILRKWALAAVGVVSYVHDIWLMGNVFCCYAETTASQCVCLGSVDSCG